eukprot:CAMPEP_0114255854 /NCGR_PEP_ID=MMETSP0058-20121206/17813_1 /TAXON_ID=36894 /ORGANISM="Pyramimonas parkeae, CCMP726" /LENGTH=256 /DNA_ID=CAMNT_0001370325 /DNA_START=43 /DNA_END=810 /DNA_ORIENTATION=+
MTGGDKPHDSGATSSLARSLVSTIREELLPTRSYAKYATKQRRTSRSYAVAMRSTRGWFRATYLLLIASISPSDTAVSQANEPDTCPSQYPERKLQDRVEDKNTKHRVGVPRAKQGYRHHWAQSQEEGFEHENYQAGALARQQLQLVKENNALEARLRKQELKLEWTRAELNNTNRRLAHVEAAYRELGLGLQALQAQVLCNNRGEWLAERLECVCHRGFPPNCVDFASTTARFAFTGEVQSWTVPADGTTHVAVG